MTLRFVGRFIRIQMSHWILKSQNLSLDQAIVIVQLGWQVLAGVTPIQASSYKQISLTKRVTKLKVICTSVSSMK